MSPWDDSEHVLIPAGLVLRDRYCATEIYSILIRYLRGGASKDALASAAFPNFQNTKSRDKSQISCQLDPASHWSCSQPVLIPARSSNFQSTIPERQSLRECDVSTDRGQKLCSYQPAHQILKTTKSSEMPPGTKQPEHRKGISENHLHQYHRAARHQSFFPHNVIRSWTHRNPELHSSTPRLSEGYRKDSQSL